MSKFYTNVQSIAGHVLYRGFIDGKRVKAKIEYGPSLFLPTNKPTKYKSLQGVPLEEKKFDNIYEARDFVKKFDGLPGAPKIYGQTRFEYSYIAEQHPEMVDYDVDKIDIGNIDIEVGSENGFPDPYEANEPITAICLKS